MVSPDCLCNQWGHIKHRQFSSFSRLHFRRREAVCYDNSIDTITLFHFFKAFITEQSMSCDTIHSCGSAAFHTTFCRRNPRAGIIETVINNENRSILDIAYKSYCSLKLWVLELLFFFFVARDSSVHRTTQSAFTTS